MQRSAEIERLAYDLVAAIDQGDIDTVLGLTSHDEDLVFIGSDPAEYARGFDDYERGLRESIPEQRSHIRAYLDEVHCYEHGPIGWLDGIGRFERDGESVHIRITRVLHREDSEWRVVQSHISIGVPNDRMFANP